jgi:hypothetical protein
MLLQELMKDDMDSSDIMEFSAQNVQDEDDEPLAFSSGGAIAAALEQQDPGISSAIQSLEQKSSGSPITNDVVVLQKLPTTKGQSLSQANKNGSKANTKANTIKKNITA